jgi:hypothetical protein
MRKKQRHAETYMICAQTRTLFTSTAHEILAKSAVSSKFVYDNVIDIIPDNSCQ